MYQPRNHWLWDFWLAWDGRQHHLYYLQAPQALGDPEARHRKAAIGHAVSIDLRHWYELGETFRKGQAGAWDDRCTWTGSIQPTGNCYAMLYAGTNQRQGSSTQHIGLAWSDDLHHWQRGHSEPVIPHDSVQYFGHNTVHANECAWRDPYLFQQAGSDDVLVLLAAQVAGGDASDGGAHGAIASAHSHDWRNWTVTAPIYSSPGFFLMEIPQLITVNGWYYLSFSVMADWIRLRHLPLEDQARTGTYYVYSRSLKGPWHYGGRLCGTSDEMHYGFKLIQHQSQLMGLYWRGYDQHGHFLGDLSDPLIVHQQDDGQLIVAGYD